MKIQFDLDGVFNNLTEVVCKDNGIDIRKIVYYNLKMCKRLRKAERERILECFGKEKYFRDSWIKMEEQQLREFKAMCYRNDIIINSLSFTQEIADIKKKVLLDNYPWLLDEMMVFPITNGEHIKRMYDCDIIVEDCFDNIMKAKAQNGDCIGIMIRHSYNANVTDEECEGLGIIPVSDLLEAMDIINSILACIEIEESFDDFGEFDEAWDELDDIELQEAI